MNGAMVIRWGAPIPGREAKGLEVFGRAIERFETLAKEGRIQEHHAYFALTGRAGGMMVVSGELDVMQAISVEPETLALNAQAEAITQDFEITFYAGGTDQSLQEVMGTYTTAVSELGYL